MILYSHRIVFTRCCSAALLTMVSVDLVTNHYRDQGTTMRAIPFPDYLTCVQLKNNLNTFYSVCQICAISQVLFSYHLEKFSPLYSPFRWHLFSWHVSGSPSWLLVPGTATTLSHYYRTTLLDHGPDTSTPGGLFFPSALLVCVLRLNLMRGFKKYIIWGMVVAGHIYAMTTLNRYTTVVV